MKDYSGRKDYSCSQETPPYADTARLRARIADLQGAITMAGLKVAELEAENEVFKSLYLNEQGRSESLWVDAERYQWLRKQEHPTSPESFWVARGGYGPVGISIWWLESLDEAIDAARSK